jgi:hypothetical protein
MGYPIAPPRRFPGLQEVFAKMKLRMKREALGKLNRLANEMPLDMGSAPQSGTAIIQ